MPVAILTAIAIITTTVLVLGTVRVFLCCLILIPALKNKDFCSCFRDSKSSLKQVRSLTLDCCLVGLFVSEFEPRLSTSE